jgi:CheY-like chemotaxis protein
MHSVVRMVLEPAGFDVICCRSVRIAREKLARSRPDALLLDIMLASPREGLEFAKEIKKDVQLHRIPIIMITSVGKAVGEEYASQSPEPPPWDVFLEKPLDAQRLREALEQVI